MADTDSLDLDAIKQRAIVDNGLSYGAAVDLILYARSLRSQLAESQQENATLKRRLVAAMTSPEWTMVRCDVCGQIAPPHKHTVMAS